MVGCNLRFHPAIRDAKDIVEKHKVIFARAEYGYYLPFWRKGDYRKSYSAGIDGGIILDDIHELDYLYWLFGNFIDLKMVYAKVSDLEIMQEDVAEISILFQNGTTGSIHQDYLCKNYHRTLELHLGHETVKFEINPTNLAFKKEIEYFCRCVEQKIKPMNNVGEAAYVLRRIFEAKNPRCNPSTTDINQTTTEGSSGFRRKTYSGKSDRKVSTSGTSVESSSSVASSHTD
jgi:predicted dehydrogenase